MAASSESLKWDQEGEMRSQALAPREGKYCWERCVSPAHYLFSSFWYLHPNFVLVEFPSTLWIQSAETVHQDVLPYVSHQVTQTWPIR